MTSYLKTGSSRPPPVKWFFSLNSGTCSLSLGLKAVHLMVPGRNSHDSWLTLMLKVFLKTLSALFHYVWL